MSFDVVRRDADLCRRYARAQELERREAIGAVVFDLAAADERRERVAIARAIGAHDEMKSYERDVAALERARQAVGIEVEAEFEIAARDAIGRREHGAREHHRPDVGM